MMKMIKTIPLVLLFSFALLFASCTKENTPSTQETNKTILVDSLTSSTSQDSVVTPTEALNFGKHGHGNVPKIAEKAHQNPVKTGRMQSRIRRGSPQKGKAMKNTMKKKQEAMEEQKQR